MALQTQMRIAAVTSEFPSTIEPCRGLYNFRALRALSNLADVSVVRAMAQYPRIRPFRPNTLSNPRTLEGALPLAGSPSVRYVTYPAVPYLSRWINGWSYARAISEHVRSIAPDIMLSYGLYPDAFAATHVA